MREWIDRWKSSRKYHELQLKKQHIIKNITVRKPIEQINKKQLDKMIDQILMGTHSSMDTDFLMRNTADDILMVYISNLTNWFFYLSVGLFEENYEQCARIRDVITIERESFKESIRLFRPDITEEDENYFYTINLLEQKLYKEITDKIEKYNDR